MKDLINEVSKRVRTVKAKKIIAKKNRDEIDTWVTGMKEKINEGDEKVNILEQWLNDAQEKRANNDHKKKIDFEMELYARLK